MSSFPAPSTCSSARSEPDTPSTSPRTSWARSCRSRSARSSPGSTRSSDSGSIRAPHSSGCRSASAASTLKMFVTALLIQRKTGGNLSEVLDQYRGRHARAADDSRAARDADGRGQVVGPSAGAAAGLVFFGLSAIAPEFMRTLKDTSIGRTMLAGAAISVTMGYFVMMKIAKVGF